MALSYLSVLPATQRPGIAAAPVTAVVPTSVVWSALGAGLILSVAYFPFISRLLHFSNVFDGISTELRVSIPSRTQHLKNSSRLNM